MLPHGFGVRALFSAMSIVIVSTVVRASSQPCCGEASPTGGLRFIIEDDMASRLYYDDPTLTTFTAEVTDIREASRENGQSLWQIALDRSAFYPTSGGQPHDVGVLKATSRSGARLEAPVLEVVEDDAGEVWHCTQKPLLAGTMVEGRIDQRRRRDHMQQHSGQHLLSAAFIRECGAKTVSFHLGAESSTIDLAVEKLGGEEMLRVERMANEIIAENRAVSLRTVERSDAEELLASGALRKLPEREGKIRMVEIADFDLNACGGTHVRATGEIGGLLVRKVEKAGKAIRVEFVCGLRAVAAARADFETLSAAAALLSSSAGRLPEAILRLQAESKAAAKEQEQLQEEIARHVAAELVSGNLAGGLASERQGNTIVRTFPDRDLSFLKLVARNVVKLAPASAVLLASKPIDPAPVVLARGTGATVHCGDLLREELAALGARGGGSAEMAQGALPLASLEALLERVQTSLGR